MGWLTVEPQGSEKFIWWLGETKGFWVQTGALFLSAVGALWIVLSRSRSERRRATVEMMLHHRSTPELRAAKTILLKLVQAKDTKLARFLGDKESEEYKAIMTILNTNEFVACGIIGKAYDEKLYKRMACAITIRDWQVLHGFIEEFRNCIEEQKLDNSEKQTFFQDFQSLAEKWEKKPLKPSK